MPRRSLALVLTAVLGLAGACSSQSRATRAASPPIEASDPIVAGDPAFRSAPPSPSTTSLYGDPTRPRPGPALPEPIPIPRDSYAPEPVVELGTMEIPALGLTHRIFQGVTLHNIDRGPSHWTGSALPGQMGNTVFAGHRATNSEPFRRIDALVPGDQVVFTIRGARTVYRVTEHLIVSPADSWIADQTTAFTGTLYACHPVGSMAQRYVVRLEMVP